MAVSVGVWATVALGGSIGWKLEGRPVLRPPSRARLPAVRLAKVRAPPFLSSLAACPPSQCDSRVSQVGRAGDGHDTPGQRPLFELNSGPRPCPFQLAWLLFNLNHFPHQIRPELCSAQVQNLIFPVSLFPSTANCQLPTQKSHTKQQPVGTLRAAATYARVPVPYRVYFQTPSPPSALHPPPRHKYPIVLACLLPSVIAPYGQAHVIRTHSTRSPGSQGPSSLLPTVAALLKIILGGAGVDFPSTRPTPERWPSSYSHAVLRDALFASCCVAKDHAKLPPPRDRFRFLSHHHRRQLHLHLSRGTTPCSHPSPPFDPFSGFHHTRPAPSSATHLGRTSTSPSRWKDTSLTTTQRPTS